MIAFSYLCIMKSEKQRLHIERLAKLRRGKKCSWVNKNRILSQETKDKIGLKNKGKLKGRKRNPDSIKKGAEKRKRGDFFYCLGCGSKFWRNPSAIKKGHNKFCSKVCYQIWQKGVTKISGFKLNPPIGEKNSNWRGGITPINLKIRNSNKYKEWRDNIFKRDNYTCQGCGDKCGGGHTVYLEAHHIKSFSEYSELRFDINNGKTLCKECHEKTKVRKNGRYKVAEY